MSEFLSALELLKNSVHGVASDLLSAVDRISFIMLVDCLKSSDPQAVKEAVDQLVREKSPLSIPPLYLVSRGHPIVWVRQTADRALHQLISTSELEQIIQGKDLLGACAVLLERYGNYRRPPERC